MDPNADDLLRCLDNLCDASAPLPDVNLTPQERSVLGASCFREGGDVVRAVALALKRRGELYPDVTVKPDELRADLDRSALCMLLGQCLERLARCAMDHHLIYKARAVRQALGVVELVRLTAQLPGYPNAELRHDVLLPAEHMLARRQVQMKKKARRRKAAHAGAAPSPSAPPPPTTRPGARRRPRGLATAQVMGALRKKGAPPAPRG